MSNASMHPSRLTRPKALRGIFLALVAAAVSVSALAPAQADWRHDRDRHDRRGHDHRFYAPPPAVYVAPPVAYAPPPVVYQPAPSLNVVIPFRF
jgi:hypothetical protein